MNDMWLPVTNAVDSLIDGISMYRLLLYYLLGLLLAAMGLSFLGDMHYNPLYIAASASILVFTCWSINRVFAFIFDAPTNPESSILTGLILALIISPTFTNYGFLFMPAAAGLAIASKYLLTIGRKHIFNPAAIAVAFTAFGPRQAASWWVGTAVMLPFVLVGGILIMRKVRRERMVLAFLISTTVATVIYAILAGSNVWSNLHDMVLSSAVFFLSFVMLTEPYTSPPTLGKQVWYATIVGVLLPPQVHFFSTYSSPELALVVGNIFAYIVSPKKKLFPVLREKVKVAANTADFIFALDKKLSYKPGQYMEFTLPHEHADARGSRRYFTLASSPTEPNLRIGVKFYTQSSTYKEAMLDMEATTPIVAAQLAGDFVLPNNPKKKLVFIAGGIGITPFRSMVKYLMDTHDPRIVTLLYAARSQADVAYAPVFEEAEQAIGLKTVYVLSKTDTATKLPNVQTGNITTAMIKKSVPDYSERVFYISGTHQMVVAMQKLLHELGVAEHNVKTDFFPGYA